MNSPGTNRLIADAGTTMHTSDGRALLPGGCPPGLSSPDRKREPEKAKPTAPAPDPRSVLATLRAAYTPYGWAILHIGGSWTAAGHGQQVTRPTTSALRLAIDPHGRHLPHITAPEA